MALIFLMFLVEEGNDEDYNMWFIESFCVPFFYPIERR
jgi:hypothetical protein